MRRLDVDALAALAVARRIPARASSGLVDVAEWLVEPDNVRSALERFGWRGLDRLARGEADALRRAERVALAFPRGHDAAPAAADADDLELLDVARDEMTALLAGATRVEDSRAGGRGDADADRDADAQGADHARDARGAERAHALAALVADLVADLDATPRAARDGRGGPRLAGVEVRRLAGDLDLAPELVEHVAHSMHRARLAGPVGDSWAPTELGRRLERGPRIDRWRAVLEAWLDGLGVAQREAVLGEAPVVAADRGLDPVEAATELGLLVDDRLTTPGRLALAGDLDGAAAAMAPLLPAEVDGVYVQPDLSVISPGPLAPDTEARLRTVADLERRGTASTYRLSPASITRALESGLDADAIEALLRDVSLTPIPQPVTYLVAEATARHGRIRVRPGDGTGSIVSSDDADTLDQLAVDQSLSALRLRPHADGSLASTLSPAHVAAALADARFSAAVEDSRGRPAAAIGPRTASAGPPPVPASTARLAAALRDDADRQGDADDASAWLTQRLDRARRAKSPVRLRVRVQGSPDVEVRVIPASLSARWVRVIDPDADVERTFPMSAVELLDED